MRKLGEIRISRFLGSFDCGRIIDPKTAASQFRGGGVMGLGLALMEKTQFDPRTPMGARGIGKIGITGVGAAFANAVFNATGTRVRDLPITLNKVL